MYYSSVNEAVHGCFGPDTNIEKSSGTIMGGISSVKILSLSNGMTVLLKTNSIRNAGLFDAEEEGLDAIAGTGAIRTPKLYCKGTDSGAGISFLMMEFIETGRPQKDTWTVMGSEYADMHLADATRYVPGGRYGFAHDNYIGSTPQINTPGSSWIDFFRDCRLIPQINMAKHSLSTGDIDNAYRLLERLDDLLTEPEHPSLLHGDMWGGNHLVDTSGRVVLIDPAAYVGHAEADIALTEMFTPLPGDFYDAYHEKIPAQPGYKDRKEIYNLYHWLNHYNLFGGSHLLQVKRILQYFSG